MTKQNRRQFLLSTTVAGALMMLPQITLAADPIVIGVPSAQSGPVGIADHKDWQNGVELAIKEINDAGGVDGRMLEAKVVDIDILSPEGTIAAFQNLAESGVNAIASAFVLIPQPAMDTAAASGVPYVHGNTQLASLELFKTDPEKYRNIFQLDVAETWYGSGLIKFASDLKESGSGPRRTTRSISSRNRSPIRRSFRRRRRMRSLHRTVNGNSPPSPISSSPSRTGRRSSPHSRKPMPASS